MKTLNSILLFAIFSQSPLHLLRNSDPNPSLVNSVDFHPKANLFCVTYTHNNRVIIYQIDEDDRVTTFQVIENTPSKLSCPQHALFSPGGTSLIVVNWWSQTFNIHIADLNGLYQQAPIAVLPFLLPTDNFRPHGMAFSPDGNYLAVAYGASKQDPKAIALYQVNEPGTSQMSFSLLSLLQGDEIERGIPKGIAFSPDGSCLLVTLSETNAVIIYTLDLSRGEIVSTPRQILKGLTTLISRPEDIKFTVDGNYFAISNSSKDSITFYRYDNKYNSILDYSPSHIMENPEANLSFPHGLAFSADGKYLSVTQFGPVLFDENSNLSSWGTERRDSVAIYRLK